MFVCVYVNYIYFWGYMGVHVEVREQCEPFVPFFHHVGLQLDLRLPGLDSAFSCRAVSLVPCCQL